MNKKHLKQLSNLSIYEYHSLMNFMNKLIQNEYFCMIKDFIVEINWKHNKKNNLAILTIQLELDTYCPNFGPIGGECIGDFLNIKIDLNKIEELSEKLKTLGIIEKFKL